MLCVIAAAAPLLLSFAGPSRAQEQQPDLQMLLNLDLFGKAAAGQSGAGGDSQDSQSLLDQIRTLDAMGYLNGNNQQQPAPAAPSSYNQPSYQSDSSAEPE